MWVIKNNKTMQYLIHFAMFAAAFNACWWLIADITGSLFFKFLFKVVIGMGGILVPALYYLKWFEII